MEMGRICSQARSISKRMQQKCGAHRADQEDQAE